MLPNLLDEVPSMIEAIDGKKVYLYSYSACRRKSAADFAVCHGTVIESAESDDEAYGRAKKICLATYPQELGYFSHFAVSTEIGHLERVGRVDLARVEPVVPEPDRRGGE